MNEKKCKYCRAAVASSGELMEAVWKLLILIVDDHLVHLLKVEQFC